jgi:hypothetical protein
VNCARSAKWIGLFSISLALSGCGDSCSSYSKYTCEQINRADYNVYFYYPDGKEEYLGEAQGLPQCSAMADAQAQMTHAPKSWICCMKTQGSSCEEKHR